MRRPTITSTTDFAIRHPWRVVGVWVGVLVVAVTIIATLLGSALSTDARPTSHPESVQGLDQLKAHFPDVDLGGELVIVRSKSRVASDPAFRAFVADLVARGSKLQVRPAGGSRASLPSGRSRASARRLASIVAALPTSSDRHAVLLPLDIVPDDDAKALKVDDRLVHLVQRADRSPDFSVTITGQSTLARDMTSLSQTDLQSGELKFGLPVALVVLLGVFGALVGGVLPILLSFLSIICAVALVALIGQLWPVSFFSINMISGMGLALGIDYTLFLLSRFREERELGHDRDAAIARTGATASRAVAFSGVIYVVALVGMLMVQTTIMRSLALGAILVGIVAMLAALTLAPALLRLLGDRVNAGAVPIVGRRARSVAHSRGLWERIARAVMAHPAVWGGAVALLLVVLCLPAFGLRSGAAGISTMPSRLPSSRGYAELQRSFPGATFTPIRVVVHGDFASAVQRARLDRFAVELGRPKLLGTGPVAVAKGARLAVVNVPLAGDALDPAAVRAMRDVRTSGVDRALRASHLRISRRWVTGYTAFNSDYFDIMARWMPIVFAFVLGLSFLLLTTVFRSVVIAAKAIVLNLLSVGAAYGLMVYTFTHAWTADLLGFHRIEVIEAWVPLFLFSVLFGLSMDYHMFLLTRIRERFVATGDTREAVAWGVGSTGRLITGAALIIIAVFTGFARGELVMFQQMGFGVAVALLLDATLVRSVLLPAAMTLLGSANWYLPRWLEWLPEVQVDGDAGVSTPAT